jgi:hypothetical protein
LCLLVGVPGHESLSGSKIRSKTGAVAIAIARTLPAL